MEIVEVLLGHWSWAGLALVVAMVVMWGVQLYYYLWAYGRVPGYKDSKRPEVRGETPPVSVVIPLFSEDHAFVEEVLPLIVAQERIEFEVVLVYVGRDTDFFDNLSRIKQAFPCVTTTKIEMNPQFPISSKMALNIGIKSAKYEHVLFTTPECTPMSDRWISLMASGFRRGDVVIGYCGLERKKGMANYLMSTWRLMNAVQWLSSAVRGKPYRGMRQNFGFTKSLYFEANGFGHLNMNIGEDDLFLGRIIKPGNVSVVLSPRATLREKCWGGLGWWSSTQRYADSAAPFYPLWVRNFGVWEWFSRVLFWGTAGVAVAVMPWEVKAGALLLALLRLVVVLIQMRRIGKKVGESTVAGRYVFYDLWSPFYRLWLTLLRLRRDERVWR